MKIDNVVIYRLDEWNWCYRYLRKRKNRGKKPTDPNASEYIWVEGGKYFLNADRAMTWVRNRIIDRELENIEDPQEAIRVLDEIKEKINDIIKVEYNKKGE